jgi:hypothetical protein
MIEKSMKRTTFCTNDHIPSNIKEGIGGIRRSVEIHLQAPFGTERKTGLHSKDKTGALRV